MVYIDSLVWTIKKAYKAKDKGISLHELEECWNREVYDSKFQIRTFYRHVRDIEKSFGIHIIFDKKLKGYRISDFDKDATTMAMWFFNSHFLVSQAAEHCELHERILYEDVTHELFNMEPVVKAVASCKHIGFDYWKGYDEEEHREGAPLGLYLFNRVWYLVLERADGVRLTYALDRISNVEILESEFVYPENFNMKDYFKHSFGIFRPNEGKPEKVVLRFFGKMAKFVTHQPLHRSQELLKRDADSATFSYCVFITPDWVNHITSFGGDFEVVKPQSLRREIHERALAMAEHNK